MSFTVIEDFLVPDSLPEGSPVTVRILLRNTGALGRLDYYIDGNARDPDRDMAIEVGSTPAAVSPGAAVWVDVPFRYFPMPAWDYKLTASNEDGSSTISRTINLSVPTKKPTVLTLSITSTSGDPTSYVTLTAVLKSNGTPVEGRNVDLYLSIPDLGVPESWILRRVTDISGAAIFNDIHVGGITAPINFNAYFSGDSEYEECASPTVIFELVALGEFKFDSWNPGALDYREVFIVGSVWPAVVRKVDVGESVYAYYVIKNVGTVAGEPKLTIRDLDTDLIIKTWDYPELAPNARFKTGAPGTYIGKMPSRDWRLEFKVEP